MPEMGNFKNVEAIRKANSAAGEHFFSAGALNFFRSKIGYGVINGHYFITAEKPEENDPWRYTIRLALASGEVETVGEFQAYATMTAALQNAHMLAEVEEVAGIDLLDDDDTRTCQNVDPGCGAPGFAYVGFTVTCAEHLVGNARSVRNTLMKEK